ncbi:MAG: helix-turn-helix domain-containing protein, partial [bacterium]|nr:helix-turn-helix domain-containing protein [bacterium]
MAKMFYSIEEAAERLGKNVDHVRDMAAKGQLQEFRDRDRLMFKREQVDLLAGGGEDPDSIPLAESGELEPISLASSGTGISMAPRDKESTGISIFDADGTDEADANAVTRVSNSPGSLVDPGEKSGSGGLLDLTREGDDTSLGANLLEDVYGSETVAHQTAAEPAMGGGDLFESSPGGDGGESAAVGGGMLVAAEPYDGLWSGIGGGLAVAMIVALGIAGFTVIIGFTSTAGGFVSSLGDSFMILLGIMGGVLVLATL